MSNTFTGTLMHCTVKHTEVMLYIASHPSSPTLPDWIYNYPKSSAEEYVGLHISASVKALSVGNDSVSTATETSPRKEDNTAQLFTGMSDFSLKLLASKVKVPKDKE